LSSTPQVEYVLFDLTIEDIENKFGGIYWYQIFYTNNIYINNINKCKLFMIVMSSWNTNNNQSILEELIRAMTQLTERNQLM